MATNGTLLGVFEGTSFANAFPNPFNLDLIQVVNEGGKCVYNVDSAGVNHTNPTSPTATALKARLFGSSVTAAFTNPSSLDILQIVNPNGAAAVYHIDSAGVAHTP